VCVHGTLTDLEVHDVGTLRSNYTHLEAIVPTVATLSEEIGELIDLPNLGTALAFKEGGKLANQFWEKVALGLRNP
jgi:hypothetical protein